MKKQRYKIHPFFIDEVRQLIRKKKGIKKATDEEALKAISDGEMYKKEVLKVAYLIAEEYFWRSGQRSIIFPDSIETLERIRKTKFKLSMASAIQAPFESFVLAMPKGYVVDGLPLPAVMITTVPKEERNQRILRPALEKMGIDQALRPVKEDFLSLQFMGKEIRGITRIPRRLLGNVLSMKDPKEMQALLGEIPNSQGLSDTDINIQFQLTHLVCSLFVYCQATGDTLIPGFPTTNRPNIEGRDFKRATDFTLSLSAKNKDKMSPTGHYRSGHYRQLTNDRYYQGEHAKKEIGSRFVWVKDTFVGTDIDPHTLKKGSKK